MDKGRRGVPRPHTGPDTLYLHVICPEADMGEDAGCILNGVCKCRSRHFLHIQNVCVQNCEQN